MRKGRVLSFLAVVALLVGGLVYGSFRAVQVDCEVCVEFNGKTECRRGSGANQEEAHAAAQRAACATISFGMAESINCQRTPPKTIQCG